MATASDDKISVLFVCLGNICRSPLAEGLFRQKVKAAGLEERFRIASAGTGSYHVGEPPDERMQQAARRHDLDISAQRAQQFAAAHFEDFDHIFVMDKSNLHDVLFLQGEDDRRDGKVRLFREFDPDPGNFQVPDPYAGGRRGFENVFEIADRTTERILDGLMEKHDLGRGERVSEGAEERA